MVGPDGSQEILQIVELIKSNATLIAALLGLGAIGLEELRILSLKYKNKLSEARSITDSLTKTFTRGLFDEELHRELEEASRYGHNTSLIFLDFDNLKLTNDKKGHKAGDITLQCAADEIKKNCRGPDIVCRYGGDEFAVIMPETDEEGAVNVANRILDGAHKNLVSGNKYQLNKVIKEHGRRRSVIETIIIPSSITFSIGVATTIPGMSTDSLIHRADSRALLAKQLGKNRIVSTDSPSK